MLTADQLNRFEDDGFLVVEDVLDAERTLKPLIEEYETIAARLRATWIEEGRLDPAAPADRFEDFILSTYRAGLDYFQPMDISLPGGQITADMPFHAGPAAFGLLTDTRLLDAVESLIGPEITSNPIQHVRIKPPAVELDETENRAHITVTHWHQDRAVALEAADRTRMVTAWVAVTDATVENGCLQVIPGSHRGPMLLHCPRPQAAIPDGLVDEAAARPLPVRSGGVILFHPMTVHGSLENRSDRIRWSFDLRYNVTGEPTGRPAFPEFVARSRSAPETELKDWREWKARWARARDRLAKEPPLALHRWSGDAEQCA